MALEPPERRCRLRHLNRAGARLAAPALLIEDGGAGGFAALIDGLLVHLVRRLVRRAMDPSVRLRIAAELEFSRTLLGGEENRPALGGHVDAEIVSELAHIDDALHMEKRLVLFDPRG